MTLGSFTLVKNEAPWIAAHLLAWLPILDEMVFFDGNSTDGTTQIIEAIRDNTEHGAKIRLFKKKDPADLRECYVGMFNECLWSLQTDMAAFIHPDMMPSIVPPNFNHFDGAVAATMAVKSFAGEPDGPLLRIKGRQSAWKNIYRLRNPALGAHYAGHYGSAEEDVYFSAITGNQHYHYGPNLEKYPYEVASSGIEVLHFSDVRPLSRRIGRMRSCLLNQPCNPGEIDAIIAAHPRVTLKSGPDRVGNVYEFVPAEYPAEMLEARRKYQHLERNITLAHH